MELLDPRIIQPNATKPRSCRFDGPELVDFVSSSIQPTFAIEPTNSASLDVTGSFTFSDVPGATCTFPVTAAFTPIVTRIGGTESISCYPLTLATSYTGITCPLTWNQLPTGTWQLMYNEGGNYQTSIIANTFVIVTPTTVTETETQVVTTSTTLPPIPSSTETVTSASSTETIFSTPPAVPSSTAFETTISTTVSISTLTLPPLSTETVEQYTSTKTSIISLPSSTITVSIENCPSDSSTDSSLSQSTASSSTNSSTTLSAASSNTSSSMTSSSGSSTTSSIALYTASSASEYSTLSSSSSNIASTISSSTELSTSSTVAYTGTLSVTSTTATPTATCVDWSEYATSNGATYMLMCSTSFIGEEISPKTYQHNYESCAAACESSGECSAFTWSPNQKCGGGKCKLLSMVISSIPGSLQDISGTRTTVVSLPKRKLDASLLGSGGEPVFLPRNELPARQAHCTTCHPDHTYPPVPTTTSTVSVIIATTTLDPTPAASGVSIDVELAGATTTETVATPTSGVITSTISTDTTSFSTTTLDATITTTTTDLDTTVFTTITPSSSSTITVTYCTV